MWKLWRSKQCVYLLKYPWKGRQSCSRANCKLDIHSKLWIMDAVRCLPFYVHIYIYIYFLILLFQKNHSSITGRNFQNCFSGFRDTCKQSRCFRDTCKWSNVGWYHPVYWSLMKWCAPKIQENWSLIVECVVGYFS